MAVPERQLQIQRMLADRLSQVKERGRTAAAARRSRTELSQELTAYAARNRSFVDVPQGDRGFHQAMLRVVPAAYVLDLLLFGVVADYLAKSAIALFGAWAGYVAFAAVPAVIIYLERALGAYRASVHRASLLPHQSRVLGRCLTALYVVIAVALPLAGLLPYLPKGSAMPTTGLGWLLKLGVVLLAVPLSTACHAFILLAADKLHDAETWRAVDKKCKALRTAMASQQQTFATESRVAADLWAAYIQDLDIYNASFEPRLPVPPVDRETRAIINEVYSDDVIRAAPTPPAAAQPIAQVDPGAAPAAAPPRRDAVHSDEPDWEALYRLQQRDDDSEVRA